MFEFFLGVIFGSFGVALILVFFMGANQHRFPR